MSTFWYRRVCEIGIITSIVVIALWSLQFIQVGVSDSITPSWSALLIAVVTLGVSAAGFVLQRKDVRNTPLTVSTAILLSATALATIAETGNLESPYLVLWMLAGIFAAILGLISLLPVVTLLSAYTAYLWFSGILDPAQLGVYCVVFILPLLVSYSIWSRRFQVGDQGGATISDLALELSQESSKSEIIINAIADGVVVVDANGIIQLINPAAQNIIGWGNEDALRLDYRSVLKIVDSNETIVGEELDPVQQCLKTNEAVVTDKFGLRTVSGKKLIASILISPIGKQGEGAIIIFRDVTSQYAEEREQAEFISTASHEMRTPVAAIEGYLGLALNPQTATIDDKARTYLGQAHEAAQHLGRLFQDLLDITKLEDGRLKNVPAIFDVSAQTKAMLSDFRQKANEKGLDLVFKPDHQKGAAQTVSPIFYTSADPDHYREVFSNLVENAIKYTKEGTVTVDVNGSNERVLITVTDSGIGIPAEDIPHLFQKFYRVDNTDTREIGGTGLGLYLSRRLTENMDGRLSVDSEYGKGSTFTIDLPRLSQDKVDTVVKQAAQNPPTPTAPPTPSDEAARPPETPVST